MLLPVIPLLQEYVDAPEAESDALFPEQITVETAVAVTLGVDDV